MKKRKILLLVLILLLISACSPAEPTNAPPLAVTTIVEPTSSPLNNIPQNEASVPRISLEETLAAINSGAAVIVDVRSLQSYEASHIKGAISIPLAEIESNPSALKLEKDQWIITYCT